MEDIEQVKTCNICNEVKPKSKFYKYQGRCCRCSNKIRLQYYIPNPKGFRALPNETKIEIKKQIENKEALKDITKKHSISYSSLRRWKAFGLFQNIEA